MASTKGEPATVTSAVEKDTVPAFLGQTASWTTRHT
jgi:hypothetical protein